ncbi:MAG: lipid-A-disaccharide synthase [Candidatus Aminicenantes bacterium]|nr:lipid-A-disaccharide synthase [Candidatus Aminicenantes bacterium]
MASILIVAGENSGEKYGAGLVRQFKKISPAFSFFGIGGEYMAAEGVEIIVPMEKLAVVGAVEILSHLPRLKIIFDQLKKEISMRRPVVSILIDSPDFNLRLAKKIKKLSIPVLYYISPTVWAWRKGRLKTIERTVDKMLLIFPFEEEIYQTRGIPAVYIGHPLLERVRVTLSKEDFFQKYGLGSQKKLITLLPGSRKSELKYHMPVLAKTIQKIKKEIPAHFILVLAEGLAGQSLERYVPADSDHVTVLTEDNYEAMAYSDLVLSSCGTANLESALLETPFISFYRLSPFTYYAGVRFIRIRNYSIVNILAGKKIVPELIQKNFSPENICTEAKRILDSEESRSEMISNFRKIKELLGDKKASQNAAQELDKLIKKNL